MKNWKYINGAEGVKIGNEKAENTWTLQDAKRNYEAAKKEFEKNGDMFSKRKLDEVKSIIDKEYYAAYKRLEELERKRNDNMHNKGGSGEIPYYNEAKQNYAHWGLLRETIGNDTPAEYAKRPPKIVGGNSLPEELEKDVEKKDKEKVEDIEELKKTGNEASDDKFAYVMREFDEGKLKTPDGKVVTDPEQAKAIAYSESKKTENGLARARKAMAKNKKVGNSTRVVDQETIGGIRTYVFYDDSDNVYYVSDKGQGPLGNIFDNPSFKTKDEAKRYIKQRIS